MASLQQRTSSYSLLQHPTSSYTILQNPTSSYSILQHPAALQGIIQHPAVTYSILQHPTATHNILQHPTASFIILQHLTASYSILQYLVALNCLGLNKKPADLYHDLSYDDILSGQSGIWLMNKIFLNASNHKSAEKEAILKFKTTRKSAALWAALFQLLRRAAAFGCTVMALRAQRWGTLSTAKKMSR